MIDIMELNIPTSIPLVYEFDENLRPIRSTFLGNADEIKSKMDAVAK